MNVKALVIASMMVVTVLFIPAVDGAGTNDMDDDSNDVEIVNADTICTSEADEYKIPMGVKATLDVNGCQNVLIYNYGDLTIIDSGSPHGNVYQVLNFNQVTVNGCEISILANTGSASILSGEIQIVVSMDYNSIKIDESSDEDGSEAIVPVPYPGPTMISMKGGTTSGILALGNVNIDISGGDFSTVINVLKEFIDDIPDNALDEEIGKFLDMLLNLPISNIIASGNVDVEVTGGTFSNTLEVVSSIDEMVDAIYPYLMEIVEFIMEIENISSDEIDLPESAEELKNQLADELEKYFKGLTLKNYGTVSLKNYYENGKYISGEPEQNWGGERRG